MTRAAVKFNDADQPDFFKVLKQRVSAHFKDNNISRHGNWNMVLKTVFMVSLYCIPLLILDLGVISNVWIMLSMWVIMGFAMAGIGLAVMHDANHGAYSKNQRINDIVGMVLNLNGGYHYNWRIQHNVLHHTYTNVDGYDEDIEKQGIVRFSPTQERKSIFKYQIYYVPFLYAILTLYWFVFKDIEQILRYHKLDLLKTQGLTLRRALFQIITMKIVYLCVTILLPIYMMNFSWWLIIVGYLIMNVIAGLILALIFQSAHVIEETDFYEVDENGRLENNWAIHQMRTTANFATKARVFSWFVGGLNFQVEHHLFPNICHVHYKDIAPIVKATALEFNVPYHEHKTFGNALVSHFKLIHSLGTGSYDANLAKAE